MLDTLLEFMANHNAEVWGIWGAVLTIVSLLIKISPSERAKRIFETVIKVLNALNLNPHTRKEAKKKELEREINERDNDRTRANLTDELR